MRPAEPAPWRRMNPPRVFLTTLILSVATALHAAPAPFSGDVDARAAALVAQMTLEEKIGQMIQADYLALTGHEEDVTRLALGSVLNGGNSDPGDNSPRAWVGAI